MPSSSRARRRSERVRGLMPSSERSSSQKRLLPFARSRMIRRVHLPEMTSAVRQTGHRELLIALISGHRCQGFDGDFSPGKAQYSAKASLIEAVRIDAGLSPDDCLAQAATCADARGLAGVAGVAA